LSLKHHGGDEPAIMRERSEVREVVDSKETVERCAAGPERTPDDKSMLLRVSLLGCFEVAAGTRVIREDEWRLRKAASLVKLLALTPGHRLHRERLMDLFWPDLSPRSAANNFYQAMHVARRVLEQGDGRRCLILQGERLSLCPDGALRVDVEAFEEAAAARRARDPATYRAALELYTGDLLPGDLYEEWTEPRRGELRRMRLACSQSWPGSTRSAETQDRPSRRSRQRCRTSRPTKRRTRL
jgi:two-component SAPR family response regulator